MVQYWKTCSCAKAETSILFQGHLLDDVVSCVTNYPKHSAWKQGGFYLLPALSLTSSVNVNDSTSRNSGSSVQYFCCMWGQLGSSNDWAGLTELGWKVREGFTHMADAWVLCQVVPLYPHALAGFVTIWWS